MVYVERGKFMKIQTKWQGQQAFTAIGDSGYEMKMDVNGKGCRPTELLLAALSGCMGISIMTILKRYEDQIDSLELETDGYKHEGVPSSFANITIMVKVMGTVDSKHIWRAIHLAEEKYCTVSNSIQSPISFRLMVNGEEVPTLA